MVVGLEVHVQLATKTKLFCPCPTDGFGAPPNSRICPLCTGQPGALPVLNRAAVELAFRAALALDCRLAPVSIFARKNYFYPDQPKGYQISQYESPFALDGRLSAGGRLVRIRRVHLEEDAGKLLHAIGSRELDCSLVDFNRAGIPLIEIVSDADIRSGAQAAAYLEALKEIIQYVGVSRCDMEKGEMRCDANISIRRVGAPELGARVEIKNLNSVRAVRDALDHEFKRQARILAEGGCVAQETRLWDPEAEETCVMRTKEEAHDYRYFPDPDLLPLVADPAFVEKLRAGLPELPAARRLRFMSEYGLSDYDAALLTSQRALADYFEAASKGRALATAKTAANLMATELLGRLNAEGVGVESCRVKASEIGAIAELVQDGTLSSKGAKAAFAAMWEGGDSAATCVARLGLAQVSDEAQLRAWVKEALSVHFQAALDAKAGKERALGALVGAVMKLSRGQANPGMAYRLIRESLGL